MRRTAEVCCWFKWLCWASPSGSVVEELSSGLDLSSEEQRRPCTSPGPPSSLMLDVKVEEEEEVEEEDGSRRRPLLRRLRTRLHCWAKASRMRRFSTGQKINQKGFRVLYGPRCCRHIFGAQGPPSAGCIAPSIPSRVSQRGGWGCGVGTATC
ncbi:hypothetical protein EYF80_016705 [Liparis tanakae]|uniref:Uncharacterized protein n=1 Tax=Liparis tanakae TaxID=230148 RepID=A0A4Z2I6E6_9TELE|nr:hypothetical protein EYF80_016705 [Liparis tanakae]